MTKWMLYVAISRASKRNCRAAKVTFVATRNVGVGPGVKTADQRFSTKLAMAANGVMFYVDS